MRTVTCYLVALAALFSAELCAFANDSEQMPRFSQQTVATDLAGGYQVIACDLNGDGKPGYHRARQQYERPCMV